MSIQTATAETWHEANQRHLTRALARVKDALQRHAAGAGRWPEHGANGLAARSPSTPPVDDSDSLTPPDALSRLCASFNLSSFERDVLLLCAGVELDASFGPLCAAAHGDDARAAPTLSLALAALPGAHWSAITPAAPLRYWRLIEVGAGSTLTLSPLRIDERILHFLAGVPHPDERLAGLVETVETGDALLAASHRQVAARIVGVWQRGAAQGQIRPIQVCGHDPLAKRAVVAAACRQFGLKLSRVSAAAVPMSPAELDGFLRLWQREAVLSTSALLLDCDELDAADPARALAVEQIVEQTRAVLIVTSRERRPDGRRPLAAFDVEDATADEQAAIWRQSVGAVPGRDEAVEALVSQFRLSAPKIQAVCAQALSAGDEPSELASRLWDACRAQARPRIEALATRIEPRAGWDDLVLPEPQRRVLREVAAHVRQRACVYERWGFAARYSRGLGISLLAVGPSGTGKTMAAEVLANELRLDLYHIDLSQVVNKYIGETEKNLARLFDAADGGGAILLFDEADALFGKRGEVKDSHDRYANIEVSYLLQRMEAYRGLAILTTNMKDALDAAFLRRIRFVVKFPFPDAAQRAEIWRRVFPAATPTENLDVDRLARLNLSGGNIRAVAMNAAFLAAEAGEPVRMKHLADALRSELAKLEKPLSESELGTWT